MNSRMPIPTPGITILGVYRPHISWRVYLRQWTVTRSNERTKTHFKDLVLIEAVIEHVDGRFKMSQLGQPYRRGDYPDHFQCAYDEALLSPDGNNLIERDSIRIKAATEGPLRFAFYLHYYDSARPLQWSYGQIPCPPVEVVPKRLRKLVPYNANPQDR
jgi:hypothetical protein